MTNLINSKYNFKEKKFSQKKALREDPDRTHSFRYFSFEKVPSALEIYRRVLAAAEDNTVAISSIGLLTNLADLLKSPPDDISTMNGYELVQRKVKLLATMGGKYPKSDDSPECNFCGCFNGATPEDAATAEAASAYVVCVSCHYFKDGI